MKPDFALLLQCPARDCQSKDVTLNVGKIETLHYKDGPLDEVREGSLDCPLCGRSYPIHEYVPSFDQLYPPGLQREAEYWGKWYGFMWQRGYLGFFDLRAPMAPLITEGIEVLDPSTLDHKDLGGSHSIIADHPNLANAEWLLDVGCGTGWSSLYFARRGHKVVGFDPAVANMRLAKRYAIYQHEYIEYMGAAMGFLDFKPSVFDGAVALHSIHHVPNLQEEMPILCGWLRNGAGVGIDEHVRNDEFLTDIRLAAQKWAQEEVYPRVRTLPLDVLAGLPHSEPSEMEGAGSEDTIEAFLDNFEVDSFDSRYISLDSISFLYYLSHLYDKASYDYAGNLIHHVYNFLKDARSESAEHVILIGHKGIMPDRPDNKELRDRALKLSKGNQEIERLRHELKVANDVIGAKNIHIKQLERWAHDLERDLLVAQASPLARVRNNVARIVKQKRR